MLRLTIGAAQLPVEIQERHGQYVLQQQNSDGGWAGREGESDVYYTSFALRSLAILGLLDGDVARRSSEFLISRMSRNETIVDLLSLVFSAKLIEAACGLDSFTQQHAQWPKRLTELLEQLRTTDGGYAKTIEGHAGSTYQTFLVLLCLELIDTPVPNPDEVYRFLINQRQQDGGFLEIRVGKRSGTNPTAAAIGALRVLRRIEPKIADEVIDFLLDVQTDEGGFRANGRIPVPDLLSTFTALVTLTEVNGLHEIEADSALRYALSMQRLSGGFCGFEFDTAEDVEYTFYGLGTLALLASEAS
ncbi:MAG TPA: beta-hydroxylase [Planctomycetaceae bacterium]|nr:beta-hydroxylase [Planctomycetaceae bacterium]